MEEKRIGSPTAPKRYPVLLSEKEAGNIIAALRATGAVDDLSLAEDIRETLYGKRSN